MPISLTIGHIFHVFVFWAMKFGRASAFGWEFEVLEGFWKKTIFEATRGLLEAARGHSEGEI